MLSYLTHCEACYVSGIILEGEITTSGITFP